MFRARSRRQISAIPANEFDSDSLGSVRHGILSHTLAEQLAHDSVAMAEIQQIRTNKQIPGGRPLHEYANLYFDALKKQKLSARLFWVLVGFTQA